MSGLERQSKYWPVTLSGEDYWSISRPWTDADWNQRRILLVYLRILKMQQNQHSLLWNVSGCYPLINTIPLSSYAFRVKYGMKKPRWLSSFTYNYSLSVLFLFPFSLINFETKFAICIESCSFYRLFGLKIEDSLVYHDCFSTAKLENKDKNFTNCIYCPLMLCWICMFVTDKEMDSL